MDMNKDLDTGRHSDENKQCKEADRWKRDGRKVELNVKYAVIYIFFLHFKQVKALHKSIFSLINIFICLKV